MDISGYVNALMNHRMEGIDGKEVLDILFEYYDTQRRIDGEGIRSEYNRFYEPINRKSIHEITEIEMPLYELISLYEMRGFKEGVKAGLSLDEELRFKIKI